MNDHSTGEDRPRPFVLAETNWKTIQEHDYRVAILPWGATEAHNYHLPYATDNIQADAVAIESARIAWEAGERVIVLPCIPFGVNTGQLDIDFCINMNPSTQFAVLEDICEVLEFSGIEKLVILNGHGGNHFKQIIRELYPSHPDLFVCAVNWWAASDPDAHFEEPGNHAGELETSMVMHLESELVLPLAEAGDGAAKEFRFAAFKEGWAMSQRIWSQVTADTGVGDPKASTAEKGKRYFEACTQKIGTFFIELAQADVDELYE
ncbi:MAG: creatininase family protein [Planctomycetota bacterium]